MRRQPLAEKLLALEDRRASIDLLDVRCRGVVL
jgi:hypothetical protein